MVSSAEALVALGDTELGSLVAGEYLASAGDGMSIPAGLSHCDYTFTHARTL